MLLWSVESAFAEDFFAPTMVSIEPSTYGCGKSKNVDISTSAYTRAAQQAAESVGRRRNALGINAAKRVSATSAGSPGVVFSGGNGGYRSFSSTRASQVARTADVSVPFSSVNFGSATASPTATGPFKAPPGPPIGQFVPLSGELSALFVCMSAYAAAVALRRRRKSAPSAQK